MTKEQLSKYEELHELLQKRCEEIWLLMIPLDKRFDCLSTIDEVCDDVVWGSGNEYWPFTGRDVYLSFPKSFIYESNNTIKKYVEDKVREKEAEEEKEEALKKEKERKLYEKLKAKYEN